jgi:hypothetical protein
MQKPAVVQITAAVIINISNINIPSNEGNLHVGIYTASGG